MNSLPMTLGILAEVEMNPVRWTALVLGAIFLLLLPISRGWAFRYLRVAVLACVAGVMVVPFVWLVCAAFKDHMVMNEFTFLPPLSKISTATINLGNFRTLFSDHETILDCGEWVVNDVCESQPALVPFLNFSR